ncbi:MAG: transcriptional regulator NrdR, partial [Candidatus Omnitrophica bacterium]|nr:transcriptional regulator NrdR [Candidatus Omnitrophota bacterium]
MKCPFCSYKEDKVVDSRATSEESAIRRRRECLKCGKRFT